MKKKILVVEDNELAQEMLAQQLEDEYDVFRASDGQEAIEIAARENPDVILMDIFLPEVDGWTATRKIRENVELKDVPIIALTAHVGPENERKCLEAGCNLFLAKPIKPDVLKDKIRECLKK